MERRRNDESFNQMHKLVCSMMLRPESLPFHEPVDWKGLGLEDYLDIITHPMDLGTVKKYIEGKRYKTIEEAASDIRLVWSNCMRYNVDGSEVKLYLKNYKTYIYINMFIFL